MSGANNRRREYREYREAGGVVGTDRLMTYDEFCAVMYDDE